MSFDNDPFFIDSKISSLRSKQDTNRILGRPFDPSIDAEINMLLARKEAILREERYRKEEEKRRKEEEDRRWREDSDSAKNLVSGGLLGGALGGIAGSIFGKKSAQNSEQANMAQQGNAKELQSKKEFCPSCGDIVEPNEKFCNNCGINIKGKKICAKCGKENEPANKFCPECGNKLN